VPLRIVLADDHAVVRSGLKLLLEAEEDMEVVAVAGTAADALRYTLGHKPDVLVLDLNMPGAPSLPAIPELAAQRSSRWSESLNKSCGSRAAANHGRIETTSGRSPGPGVQAGSRTTLKPPGTGGGASAAEATKVRRVRRSSTASDASRAGSDRLGGSLYRTRMPSRGMPR